MEELIKVSEVVTLGSINYDLSKIKEEATSISKTYKGLVITEEQTKSMKIDLAMLRAKVKEIETVRKEVGTVFKTPLTAFETEVKEVVAILNETILECDGQVKAHEQKKAAEKIEKAREFYLTQSEVLKEFIAFEELESDKWQNVTMTLEKIKAEILERLQQLGNDIHIIKSMGSDATQKALEEYKRTKQLSSAINTINDFEENKRLVLEKQRQDELERIRTEERQRVAEEEAIRVQAKEEAKEEVREEVQAEFIESLQAEETNELPTMKSYIVSATKTQFEKIEMYMDSIGVDYE